MWLKCHDRHSQENLVIADDLHELAIYGLNFRANINIGNMKRKSPIGMNSFAVTLDVLAQFNLF